MTHNPCATCGACCRRLMVSVSGYDVWLISARQRLDPAQFLTVVVEEESSLDGFRLDADSPPLGLALERHGKVGQEQPCIFLMRLGEGNDRCGIYDHRPDVCRVYPMSMWDRIVFQSKDPLCPPGSWPVAEIERPAWRVALSRQHKHFDVYCEVVARWNAHVAAMPEARFELEDYYSYLLDVYNRLASMEAELDVEEVLASWPTLPRQSLQAGELDPHRAQFPWVDCLLRAREVIDGFFPEVAPQPLLALDAVRWSRAFGRANNAREVDISL